MYPAIDVFFWGDLMSKERDINTLFKLTRKFGQTFGCDGSYEELDFKDTTHIQFNLDDRFGGRPAFSLVFPKTPSKLSVRAILFHRNIKKVYRSVRSQFKELWCTDRMVFRTDGSVEKEELLKEMWDHIAPDERFCQVCEEVWYECRSYPRCSG